MSQNRFAKVAALDLNSPVLPWIYAIHNQETLWMDHDALWVRKAASGDWPDKEMHRFLGSYNLLRGVRGALLAGPDRDDGQLARDTFKALACKYAKEMRADDAEHNTAQWRAFDKAFFNFCDGKGWLKKDGVEIAKMRPAEGDWFMPSATLKAMWFFAPDMAPMYDRNAKNAIRALFKQKDAGPDTFLDLCYTLRMQEQWNIKMAQSEWGACYPYPIRILDKYLWLKGSKTAKCVLKRFQAACRDLARHHSEP